MTNKTRLTKHLKKRDVAAKIETNESEIIELQTLSGNDLESYYMRVKNLDEDSLTMFWKPKQAANNAQDGNDMIQSAVDGYKDVLESLTKGYNSVQSANDTFKESDWQNLRNKLDQVIGGISTIARFTEYNGQVLINGEYASSTGTNAATFLVGVKPTDVVTYSPIDMSPDVLGELDLQTPATADDGTEIDLVYLDHFFKSGHEGEIISINSTDTAQLALEVISAAIEHVKETLSDAGLTQNELERVKGFMENKAEKGLTVLTNFKNDRAIELAQEIEDLTGQLELLNTMRD
tara:strand:- start:3311 stop:4186 length:876 start_codon:yes stop_codon:yes gene_type:complete